MKKISFNFDNKTAVITGGAQGFGLDIAKRFLNSGAKVIIWDIDPKMLEKSLKEITRNALSRLDNDIESISRLAGRRSYDCRVAQAARLCHRPVR